jgi:uncharacterized protein YerC
MKVKAKKLTDKQRIETLDALYTAAGTVRGREAMKLFLRDLLTESERIMLGRRILIARKLIGGTIYDDIASELRVGHDTIYRVHRWLYDQFPGYERVIKDMEQEFKKRQEKWEDKKLYATSMLYRLKKKYPLHFLLFPTPKIKK